MGQRIALQNVHFQALNAAGQLRQPAERLLNRLELVIV